MIARSLAVVALAAAGVAGVQTWRIKSLQTDVAERQAEAAAEVAAAERRAREAEQLMADGARKAADRYAQQINKARTDARGALSELDRLRDVITAPRTAAEGAAAAAGTDDASRARIVVGQCAATLQALAATADQCEARLIGLQDWAKAVTK